jgi:hypothetical protein
MSLRKRLRRNLLVALCWLLIGIGTAHAHGGMAGPDELGPPLGLSVTIGLACYWGITLWPTRRRDSDRKNDDPLAQRASH